MTHSTETERAEFLALADRLDAWANLVSSGYEVPAAGTTMTEVASALRRLAAQDQKPQPTPGWDNVNVSRDMLLTLISVLDCALGDTDPSIDPDYTDDEVKRDYPVFWVCQQLAALSKPAPVAANASAELQNDLAEMLRALGMSDAAQPKSPHDVFQSAIAEMKRQIANAEDRPEMTEDQIKYMVDRFLGWKLPRDTFNPDCGISFNKEPFNTHTPYPSRHEPSGTNLFDATQATAMVRYMLEGLPRPNASAEARLREALQTIIANTEEDAIPHIAHDGLTAYQSLAKDISDCARSALSAHPHASDCDNQKECCDLAAKEPCPDCPYPVTVCVSTKPEGGVEGHAIPRTTSATTTRYPATEGEENMVAPARRTEEQSSTKTGQAGIESGPSDSTTDVTLAELTEWVANEESRWDGAKAFARALLDAYGMWSR